jgi:uncharacterized peroxidase-related enzyme
MTDDHTEPAAPGFLPATEPTAAACRLFDENVDELGYIMNATRLWAYRPESYVALFDLITATAREGGLSFRQRGILVIACASVRDDSYCSLAWGSKLAARPEADAATAAGIIRGDDDRLTSAEQAMASWARAVALDPSSTTEADVQVLRDTGFSDPQIFAITVFVALRLAFSAVNGALGAQPDAAYHSTAPRQVLEAVTFGRPVEGVSDRTG